MQKLVNEVYKPKQIDKLKVISRFEYEQRDVRHKLDTADIYLQLEQIKEALEGQGVELKDIPNHQEAIMEMVKEDRQAILVDLVDLEHDRRQNKLKGGSLVEKARTFVFGKPLSSQEVFAKKEVKVKVQPDAKQNAVLESILSQMEKLVKASIIADPVPEKSTENKLVNNSSVVLTKEI